MLPLLPDILLLLLGFTVLVVDIAIRGNTRRGYDVIYAMSCIGLAVIIVSFLVVPRNVSIVYLGAYAVDGFGYLMKLLFTIAALLTILLSRQYFTTGGNGYKPLKNPAEFIYLMIFSTAGSFFVVSSRDLLTLFVSLEMATIPLYVLSAFNRQSRLSSEASTKYVIMGSVSTAVLLFGYSYLYGITGGIHFDDIGAFIASNPDAPLLMLSVTLIFCAIGFKLTLAPFHMWAPDVYDGAPGPVTAFLSVSSKATAISFLCILFYGPFAPIRERFIPWLIAFSALTMVAGNLGALRQERFLRFMAYSSIAQAGYILMAFLGPSELARTAVVYYLFIYAAANFSMFFIMAAVGQKRGETFDALRGLSRENPAYAALLATALFSLAGIPPAAGFTGKFMLFGGAASTGHYGLVIFAALNSTVSLYYYLLVMREAYMTPAPEQTIEPIIIRTDQRMILILLFIATILLGLIPGFSNTILNLIRGAS